MGSNNSGYYDLQAVLTHQGRSSSSGHYVGWVKRKEDEWVKFDDDKVSVVSPEDILRLSGGGDWHIAYVLLYGPRRLEILDDEEEHEPPNRANHSTNPRHSLSTVCPAPRVFFTSSNEPPA